MVRVRYEVEETRVGQKTNFDKLNLEIWTDGSDQHEIALVEAAKDFPQAPQSVCAVQRDWAAGTYGSWRSGSAEAQLEAKLNMSVADLRLSIPSG
ncbi:MAG: hypothetical protein R3C09_15055 [Pirellulaceae bacterium]